MELTWSFRKRRYPALQEPALFGRKSAALQSASIQDSGLLCFSLLDIDLSQQEYGVDIGCFLLYDPLKDID